MPKYKPVYKCQLCGLTGDCKETFTFKEEDIKNICISIMTGEHIYFESVSVSSFVEKVMYGTKVHGVFIDRYREHHCNEDIIGIGQFVGFKKVSEDDD